MKKPLSHVIAPPLWDAWCFFSILGIWPRWIEPKLLSITHLQETAKLKSPLRIVHYSDLHFGPHVSERYLKKIERKICALDPDLLVFTGDYLCQSELYAPKRLKSFLQALPHRYGHYAVLGNHDYAEYVGMKGVSASEPDIVKGFKALLGTKRNRPEKRSVELHMGLTQLLQEVGIELLENESKSIDTPAGTLQLVGCGDLWAQKFEPPKTKKLATTLMLSHNPDTADMTTNFDILLAGHTHGGGVYLPWMWKRFVGIKNKKYVRGKIELENGRWMYVSRGIGATLPFRWFSVPEISCITLRPSDETRDHSSCRG